MPLISTRALTKRYPGGITALDDTLDAVQDPGNFGTIIRIADWFGVKNIVCSRGCADQYNPKVVQSTMASIARVNVYYDKEESMDQIIFDQIDLLKRRYPDDRFIWLMGEDTVAQFHQWKHWRKLAESLPIAVIHRPGYDQSAHAARAMGWLRRFVRPSSQAKDWTDWSAPAILLLRLTPDPTSATGLRAHDPNWHERFLDPGTGSERFGMPT